MSDTTTRRILDVFNCGGPTAHVRAVTHTLDSEGFTVERKVQEWNVPRLSVPTWLTTFRNWTIRYRTAHGFKTNEIR